MAISLTDNLLTLPAAAALLPGRRQGTTAHAATLWRWATSGLHGTVLETVSVGGTVFTTAAALDTFLARVAEARGMPGPVASSAPQPKPRPRGHRSWPTGGTGRAASL
jgi:hypothetical protein